MTRPNLVLRYAIWNIPPEMWRMQSAPAKDPSKDQSSKETTAMQAAAIENDVPAVKKAARPKDLNDLIRADASHPKHEQAVLVRTIGQRLRQARELCNLSQIEAARQLGYANPSKLSKIEAATDTNSIPLWMIVRAAALYQVSVDFLFGLSEDFEVSPRATVERVTARWMFAQVTAQERLILDALHAVNDQIERVVAVFPKTHSQALAVARALARFRELNPGFDDARAGSTLLAAVEHAVDGAAGANEVYQRFLGHLRFMDGVKTVSPAVNAPVMEAANV